MSETATDSAADTPPDTTSDTGSADFTGFGADARRFLRELAVNNDRAWFSANRERYETRIREPALAFVRAIAPHLAELSPHLVVDAARTGGSLGRANRDTRFTDDKSPYHPTVLLSFSHGHVDAGRAPGFWLRLTPRGATLTAGLRAAGPRSLRRIREAIVERPDVWQTARDDDVLATLFGDLGKPDLQRVPRGFPSDHEHEVDLRRRRFALERLMGARAVSDADLVVETAATFAAAAPLLAFLCDALGLPWAPSPTRTRRKGRR